MNIYSYMGPIFRYGRIIKLLLEPIRTEATSVDGAYESFVLRLNGIYGNGTSINKNVIHLDRQPIPVKQFTNVQQVVEHFEQQEVQRTMAESTEAISGASESNTEASTEEKPKKTRKKTTAEATEGADE